MVRNCTLALPIACAFLLAGCGGNASYDNGTESSAGSASDDVDLSSANVSISFNDESEFIAKMATDPTLSKQLGTSVGKVVEFKDYNVYSTDKSQWEKGRNLSLLNDDSLGSETTVECKLSARDGDEFLNDTSRKHVTMKGVIQSFSSSSGLVLSPCSTIDKQ